VLSKKEIGKLISAILIETSGALIGGTSKAAWSEEERNHRVTEQKYWRRTFWLSLVALIVAGVAGIIAGLAFNEARRQANAAEDQILIAKDTEERQLRAYLIIGGFRKVENFEAKARPKVTVTLENVGQTPVYDATWLSGIQPLDYPFTSEGPAPLSVPECSKTLKRSDIQHWFFGKNRDVTKEADDPLTEPEMDALKAGKSAIVFAGRVCYLDIFNKVRRIDFCLYWHWDNGRFGDANFCEKGNSGDH
jgi:hypothetical protein